MKNILNLFILDSKQLNNNLAIEIEINSDNSSLHTQPINNSSLAQESNTHITQDEKSSDHNPTQLSENSSNTHVSHIINS